MSSDALPKRGYTGQYIESTPSLWRIDNRRRVISVAEANAGLNTRCNGCAVRYGYRQTVCMRELAPPQSGIDQVVAEDVSRDHQGHQIFWPGRHEAYPIEAQFVILAEAIEFRRRIHGADAGVPASCGLALDRRQLDKLLIGQSIGCVVPRPSPAKFEVDEPAGVDNRRGAQPGRELAGSSASLR